MFQPGFYPFPKTGALASRTWVLDRPLWEDHVYDTLVMGICTKFPYPKLIRVVTGICGHRLSTLPLNAWETLCI